MRFWLEVDYEAVLLLPKRVTNLKENRRLARPFATRDDTNLTPEGPTKLCCLNEVLLQRAKFVFSGGGSKAEALKISPLGARAWSFERLALDDGSPCQFDDEIIYLCLVSNGMDKFSIVSGDDLVLMFLLDQQGLPSQSMAETDQQSRTEIVPVCVVNMGR